MRGFLWTVGLLVGCEGGLQTQIIEHPEDEADKDGPVIEHTPITEPQVFGEDVLIEALAKDVGGPPATPGDTGDVDLGAGTGVAVVEVYYRQETSVEFKAKGLSRVGPSGEDPSMILYQGTIRGVDVGSGGMRYYIQAVDYSDNTSCLPENCEDDAWHFSVIPAS